MHKFLSLTTKSLEAKSVTTHKELWQKAQEEGYTGLSLPVETVITKEVDGDTKKFHAVFSAAVEDRHGEIVFQDFELKHFKKNPVYLDSHNYGSIESIIGKVSSLSVKEGKLQGDIEFASFNPLGALAEKLADEGFLNTSSIGFIPKAFDEKGNILKSEMLEISAVSVPANPEALYEKDADVPAPVVDEPAPVIEEPAEIAGEARDVRGVMASTVRTMTETRQRTLSEVAREIAKLKDPEAEKRQVFKAVRALMKADVSV
jgi:hypothetical protein